MCKTSRIPVLFLVDIINRGAKVLGTNYGEKWALLRQTMKPKLYRKLSDGIFSLQKIARPHTANSIKYLLWKFKQDVLNHTTNIYDSDISLCDFPVLINASSRKKTWRRRFGNGSQNSHITVKGMPFSKINISTR